MVRDLIGEGACREPGKAPVQEEAVRTEPGPGLQRGRIRGRHEHDRAPEVEPPQTLLQIEHRQASQRLVPEDSGDDGGRWAWLLAPELDEPDLPRLGADPMPDRHVPASHRWLHADLLAESTLRIPGLSPGSAR